MISRYELNKLIEYYQFQNGKIASKTFSILLELKKLKYEKTKARNANA